MNLGQGSTDTELTKSWLFVNIKSSISVGVARNTGVRTPCQGGADSVDQQHVALSNPCHEGADSADQEHVGVARNVGEDEGGHSQEHEGGSGSTACVDECSNEKLDDQGLHQLVGCPDKEQMGGDHDNTDVELVRLGPRVPEVVVDVPGSEEVEHVEVVVDNVTDRTVSLNRLDNVVNHPSDLNGAKPKPKLEVNLPKKRKKSPVEPDLDLDEGRKGTPRAGKRMKPEKLNKLKNIKKLNLITNHFQPVSIAANVGDGGQGDRGDGLGSDGGRENTVPMAHAIPVTGCRIRGKTMHSVRGETIGQHSSAVGNLSNNGGNNSS